MENGVEIIHVDENISKKMLVMEICLIWISWYKFNQNISTKTVNADESDE